MKRHTLGNYYKNAESIATLNERTRLSSILESSFSLRGNELDVENSEMLEVECWVSLPWKCSYSISNISYVWVVCIYLFVLIYEAVYKVMQVCRTTKCIRNTSTRIYISSDNSWLGIHPGKPL